MQELLVHLGEHQDSDKKVKELNKKIQELELALKTNSAVIRSEMKQECAAEISALKSKIQETEEKRIEEILQIK